MDDVALIRAVAAQDRDAFAELYGRFAPRVAGFLRQSLPASKADEVTQEVMLRVWRKAPSFQPERASPATWIFTIARNARIDALRRVSRAEPDPDDPMWVPAAPQAPDHAFEQRRDDERVRAALAELPSGQLEVLERAYMRGQALSEVAEALKLPLGTVKSRVRLAMERLRGLLVDPG
jgi:RNA polymerase sigma-70 factor (ECF subfamily)